MAELLGFDKDGGVQRVHNWLTRGIPPAIKVSRPDLFMPELAHSAAADPNAEAEAGQPVLVLEKKA